ncbi:unnamed protein product [Somion occarium]|uniref:Pentatricopeptide repeat protein n=1 Tax=Somion occarium TaxID=3059160 RepID=A0ABP1CTX3_9APHY
MSGYARLPPGLLDLVLQRVFAPTVPRAVTGNSIRRSIARRHSHAVAYKRVATHDSNVPDQSLYSLKTQTQPHYAEEEVDISLFEDKHTTAGLSELEKRVNALKNVTTFQESLEDNSYSEEELLFLYEDLLATPADESSSDKPDTVFTEEHDVLHLNSVAHRILSIENSDELSTLSDTLSSRLRLLRVEDAELESFPSTDISKDTPATTSHRFLVSRLQQLVAEIQGLHSSSSTSEPQLPLGLLTPIEWGALARYCARVNDSQSLEVVLDLMKQSAVPISEEMLSSVVDILADAGDVNAVESTLSWNQNEGICERLRDLHIKAYLRNETSAAFPGKALKMLHEYENRALPAPQRTYTRLITHLFHLRDSTAHAHAWDLFAHMRYAAHPFPDAVTYTLMIRACATPSFAHGVETERALDLFTEMTVDHEIPPTAGAYTAAILACARSSDRKYIHEAFRLAREMLDAHRDARGQSAYAPDRRLFVALLEGSKRVGDLSRARWILAEMVKASMESPDGDVYVDEEVMMHVLNAYAAYRPPFKRSETLVKDSDVSEQTGSSSTASTTEEPGPVTESPDGTPYTNLPPQSRAEVVAEVEALMSRIIMDNKASTEETPSLRFRNVQLTPRLLNAYLSVLYIHSPFETWSERYNTIFSELGIPRNAWSFIHVLERCARTRKGPERRLALQFAEDVWKEWEAIESSWRLREPGSVPLTARQVERANAAMIRMLSMRVYQYPLSPIHHANFEISSQNCPSGSCC